MPVASNYGIVLGYNNEPIAIHLLSEPLFYRYELGVKSSFAQPLRQGGDFLTRRLIPTVRWTLAAISQDERDWLLSNIYTTDTVQVTIRTPDEREPGSPFAEFNAISTIQELTIDNGSKRTGVWPDQQLDFIIRGPRV